MSIPPHLHSFPPHPPSFLPTSNSFISASLHISQTIFPSYAPPPPLGLQPHYPFYHHMYANSVSSQQPTTNTWLSQQSTVTDPVIAHRIQHSARQQPDPIIPNPRNVIPGGRKKTRPTAPRNPSAISLLAPDYHFNPAGPASSTTTSFKCSQDGCGKVYQGKHARSIWRRHLQDKHGIPLCDQPRRTRWDNDANRPRSEEERRERTLDSKRRWARKHRKERAGTGEGTQSGDGERDDLDDVDWDDCESISQPGPSRQADFDDEESAEEEYPPSMPRRGAASASTVGSSDRHPLVRRDANSPYSPLLLSSQYGYHQQHPSYAHSQSHPDYAPPPPPLGPYYASSSQSHSLQNVPASHVLAPPPPPPPPSQYHLQHTPYSATGSPTPRSHRLHSLYQAPVQNASLSNASSSEYLQLYHPDPEAKADAACVLLALKGASSPQSPVASGSADTSLETADSSFAFSARSSTLDRDQPLPESDAEEQLVKREDLVELQSRALKRVPILPGLGNSLRKRIGSAFDHSISLVRTPEHGMRHVMESPPTFPGDGDGDDDEDDDVFRSRSPTSGVTRGSRNSGRGEGRKSNASGRERNYSSDRGGFGLHSPDSRLSSHAGPGDMLPPHPGSSSSASSFAVVTPSGPSRTAEKFFRFFPTSTNTSDRYSSYSSRYSRAPAGLSPPPRLASSDMFSSPAHPGVSKHLGLTAQPGPGVLMGTPCLTPRRRDGDGDEERKVWSSSERLPSFQEMTEYEGRKSTS